MAFSWEQLICWQYLACLLVIYCAAVAVHRRYLSHLADIPGPFWASITRLWHVCQIFKGDQNVTMVALHDKYGQFVRIAPNEVSVCHPDGATLLLRSNLPKNDWYKVAAVPDFRFQNPMATTDPKEKIARSKHFAPGYALSQILKSEPDIDENIVTLFGWIDHHACEKRPMDLDKFFSYTLFDNMGSAFFSEPFGFIKEGRDIGGTLEKNISLSRFAAIAGFYILPLRVLVNPLTSWIAILPMSYLFGAASSAIKKRIENPDARYDMISHWLNSHKKDPSKLSLRDITAQVNVNIAAGAESVSCGIQSLVYYMIRHPESWTRVRREIDDAQTRGFCRDSVVSYHDADHLPYLDACYKEALRIFSPTTMGLPRVAPKGGITIGNRRFEEGTTLSVSSQVVHASKEIWGSDAHEWNPERWMSGDTKVLDKNWLVFSAGFMLCPGRNFARMQILKIAASLVRDYDIRRVDPQSEWKYDANFTAVPHSWPVYVQKRSEASREG